jgi:hypothetical protein
MFFLRIAVLFSVTSDCPYAFPVLYHAQGLIPKRFLELKVTNKIYEKHGGRGKTFFSYPKRLDPPPNERVRRFFFSHAHSSRGVRMTADLQVPSFSMSGAIMQYPYAICSMFSENFNFKTEAVNSIKFVY